MNVVMFAFQPCVVCGHRDPWVWAGSVRVNKRSMRTSGTWIIAGPHRCMECGASQHCDAAPTRWRVREEGERRLIEYRERRWPTEVAS